MFEDEFDWTTAVVEDVTVDGIPLDGHWWEHYFDEYFDEV